MPFYCFYLTHSCKIGPEMLFIRHENILQQMNEDHSVDSTLSVKMKPFSFFGSMKVEETNGNIMLP